MIEITNMYDTDIFVGFPYNKALVEIIKELPVRVWNPKEQVWWFPRVHLDWFLDKIKGTPYTIRKVVKQSYPEESAKFIPKTTPFKHQEEGLKYGMNTDRFLLGDEQGLGKSKQAIDVAEFKKLHYRYKHTLIVCGIKTLTYNWLKQIDLHSNEKGIILGGTSGSTKKKLEHLNKIDELPYFIIINIEALRTDSILAKLKELISKDEIGMVIFDEFHKVKNPESKQGKAFLQLQPFTRMAMTGTPLMNSPLDLYSVLHWLGLEQHNYYQYKNHYCSIGDFKEVIGYKNLEELHTILDSVMLRRKKADVLDLPPKIHTTEVVEMYPEQLKIYNEVREKIIEDIDRIALSSNPFTELIRLRQVTGYPGIISSTIRVSAKFDRALEIIEDVVANGSKVVVFSQWTGVINPFFAALQQDGYNPAIITGDVAYQERALQENKFMNDPTCKVLIGSTSAMGVGLTLTAGTTVIFLDEPWNRATKEQAEDRAHRIGTTGTVNIITLVCKDTVDEAIHEVVYVKGKLSDAIVDGEIKTQNRKALLRVLLNL